jgi:hypothetical protein
MEDCNGEIKGTLKKILKEANQISKGKEAAKEGQEE